MDPNKILACDPGWSGGFAYWVDDASTIITQAMPEDLPGLNQVFNGFASLGMNVLVIEQVTGFVAGSSNSASSQFRFGENYGAVAAMAYAKGFSIHRVTPQKWQKAMSLSKSGMKGPEWKRKLRTKAQEIYPDASITLNNADAVLILHATRHGII